MDTTKEIAKKLSLTDQSIRSRLLRMRTQLREILEKEGISV
jgi:DNA-directed RNA polymerase specialized sigma24 family protein